jgi:Xaa-Pro aminopeptidase
MKAIILASGSMECADMYYASRFLSYDPFVYIEAGERRILTVWGQEVERARAVSGADEVWDQDEFLGRPETGAVSPGMWLPAVVVGAAQRAGVSSVVVPDWFPIACADALRAAGIGVTVDAMVIRSRRRAKSPAEVAAIEGALRVTEASLELIRERLRQAAVVEGSALLLDGVALSSERLQGEVRALYALHQCEGEVPIVAGGAQAADGMECGHGPLRAGEPIVCDIFPRHSDTRFHGDMTRVFYVGEPAPELVRAHDGVRRANELARSLVRPGVRGSEVYPAVCELIHGEGYSTPLHDVGAGGDALSFADFLGHGLGMDLHENWIGLDPGSTEPLREGDVVTVEPELYRAGWGCVRLEDVVLVTADGCRTLSRFDYELL